MNVAAAPHPIAFVQVALQGAEFPSVIYPGDFRLPAVLVCHYACISEDNGYTCRFRRFRIKGLIEGYTEKVLYSWTLEWAELWSLRIEYSYIEGLLGFRLPMARSYSYDNYNALYGYEIWQPVIVPSDILSAMPSRGEQPYQATYKFTLEVDWDLYYGYPGTLVASYTRVASLDWNPFLMPPPPYPSMVIDGDNSYFPAQVEHDQPFDSQAKIIVSNVNADAEGYAFLDQVYKGRRTNLTGQPIKGVESFTYPFTGKTIEDILGQTFTQTTFISSAELKFATGYIDESGRRVQTNEWLRGINVIVSDGTIPDGEDGGDGEEEVSLWNKVKVPAMIGVGLLGLLMLVKRR